MAPALLLLQEKRAAEKFNASAEGKKLQDAVAQEGVALSEQVGPMHSLGRQCLAMYVWPGVLIHESSAIAVVD